jgi:cytochrome b561
MVLHWLIAVLIIGLFWFGLYRVNLPLSPTKLQL